MNGPKQDPGQNPNADKQDFERVSAALRAGDTEQPPASLDAAVMKEAARSGGSTPSNHRRLHRWLVSGALAATLVLSVSLTVQLMVPGTAPLSTMSDFQEPVAEVSAGKIASEEQLRSNSSTTQGPATPGRMERPGSASAAAPVESFDQDSGAMTESSPAVSERENDAIVQEGVAVPTVTQEGIDSSGDISVADVVVMRSPLDRAADEPGGEPAADYEAASAAPAMSSNMAAPEAIIEDKSTVTLADDATEQGLIEITGSRMRRVDVEGPSPEAMRMQPDMIDDEDESWSETDVFALPPAGLTTESYAAMIKTERFELRQIVEAQQIKDRKEFLESFVNSDVYRREVYGHPDRWLAGISDLIDMGEIALAKNELEEFLLAYPDYKLEKRFQL